ncbi:MAG: acyl-CoA dehydrogenase [Pseudomonadales bacterium]|nr:acyl-CoA dehydrogenase [Pseudomonadales bacterium]
MEPTRVEAALKSTQSIFDRALKSLNGDLDLEQIELYDLAFSQAELFAANSLLRNSDSTLKQAAANYFAADSISRIQARLLRRPQSYGIDRTDVLNMEVLEEALSPEKVTELGRAFVTDGLPLDQLDEEKTIIRDTFHNFANEVVKPLAEEIHRNDLIVPDEILNPLREMGCFGLSVPERYGGLKPDNREDSVGMVIVTEELSRGSLGAAGSLITRPEIMARAIMEGGTEEQKQRWLPGIAAGEPLCAISVTEPNTGSDVASVALRATQTDGGWLLNGGKTWCTFAGKAGSVLVLARTEEVAGHKGLSLFVVTKPVTDGHDFKFSQEGHGTVTGRAIATLGYRGMHSYEMFYDDYFVPNQDLIGEEEGRGKGFYYTMRGFMGGRLQTAARACGLMRAAMESSINYATERRVFDQPVAEYPLSLAKFAHMGTLICACKAATLDVASMMDSGTGEMEASLVKLLACRAAETVTREAVQLFGGMGYAEETDVSRYFADARVLSIFEGAEETLAIRVIGKTLAKL